MWRKHAPMPNFVVFVKNPRIMRGFVIFPGTATSLPRLLLLRNVTIRARIHIRIQAVAPSDRQPPLPARTPRTFLTPKVFLFSVICLVMMMTSPVFFQIVRSTLLMMIARIIMLMITMMRMMMLMVMIITTMKIMMMITMVMIWSLPKPVYRSLPLPTLFLPPPPSRDREFASAQPADDSPADITPMESQPLFSSTESEPLAFSVLPDLV